MAYSVKEIFYTLQGEGVHSGRTAVFCRFSGCNLWSGREQDRQIATCQFCDTDFVGIDGHGGGKFETAEALAEAILQVWQAGQEAQAQSNVSPFLVCTGGEPLLQLDEALITALHQLDIEIAVETNGTLEAPAMIDWICVSPKANAPLKQLWGDELKLVYPQINAMPEQFADLDFSHFFLQPMDGVQQHYYTGLAVQYCLKHPQWRLSLQLHKMLGIP